MSPNQSPKRLLSPESGVFSADDAPNMLSIEKTTSHPDLPSDSGHNQSRKLLINLTDIDTEPYTLPYLRKASLHKLGESK